MIIMHARMLLPHKPKSSLAATAFQPNRFIPQVLSWHKIQETQHATNHELINNLNFLFHPKAFEVQPR